MPRIIETIPEQHRMARAESLVVAVRIMRLNSAAVLSRRTAIDEGHQTMATDQLAG
jgi:hypothetical protein